MSSFKLFYLFDAVNNEYIGTIDAQESPLEEGIYLKPENCTDVKPLPFAEGYTQIFDGKEWQYKKLKLPRKQMVLLDCKISILAVTIEFKIVF